MTTDDRDPAAANQLGNYLLGDRLAAGGMAQVFHAEPVAGRFDGPIVLKQMLPALAELPEFVAMFIEEARISTTLDHPNIVKVRDFEATDRGLFLVMDLVDGPDLLAVVTRCATLRRPLAPELAAYIACHVLEALDYAHGAVSPKGQRLDVVHRDVSPSNILITRRGHVKLADFGIARASSLGRTKEIASGTLKGKFGYMSPEQVRGESLDGRSDVFSMGIVLAEMMMLRRLFSAPNDVDVLLMVRRGDLRRLDMYGTHIPGPLLTIIRKALAVDRDDRFATADAFHNALVDWLHTGEVRTGAGRLAELLRELEREGGDLCKWSAKRAPQTPDATMSGTQTVVDRRAASQAAAAGRVAFARAALVPAARRASSPTADDELSLAPFHGPASPPATTRVAPSTAPRSGTATTAAPQVRPLDPGMVVDLLGAIVREQRTGALLLRTGDLYKEAYFLGGHPVFVRCNVMEDRFGEFLVRRRALTRDQLDRALAVLDHFGGRLGQALVSLGLIEPVEAVRLLAAQVAAKLVTACSWRTGTYEFREGEQNPWPALALELRTHPIIGRSLASIPEDRLVTWATRVLDRPARVNLEAARAFELEPRLYDHLELLTRDRHTLGHVIDRIPTGAERLLVTAAAYVLWRAGVLQLALIA